MVRTGTCGASARNSSASARVRLATERRPAPPRAARRGRRGCRSCGSRAHTTVPPGARPQRGGDQRADGGEDERGVERLRAAPRRRRRPTRRRASARSACAPSSPGRVKANTRRPSWTATWADDVRGRAEAVEPEPLGVARQPQRPVADQPAAQQRRGLRVRVAVRQREAEALVGDRLLRVAAVDVGPVKRARSQRFSRPARQYAARRRRSSPATGPRPAGRRSTPRRRSGGRGRAAGGRPRPRRRAGAGRCGRRRTPPRAASNCPGPGDGSASSATRSGRPGSSRTAALT